MMMWSRCLVAVCLLMFQALSFPRDVYAVAVDLTTFPDNGMPVPNGTVLSDQWRSIGILFDASPPGVDPTKDFGNALFFSPDLFGNVAIFSFVIPGTTTATDAKHFSIRPFFNPGESAQLVGLDESSAVVAMDEVTPADIGGANTSIRMSISGNFRTVEWRTQGDPGIAANQIEFDLLGFAGVPAMTQRSMALLSLCLVTLGLASIRLRKSYSSISRRVRPTR